MSDNLTVTTTKTTAYSTLEFKDSGEVVLRVTVDGRLLVHVPGLDELQPVTFDAEGRVSQIGPYPLSYTRQPTTYEDAKDSAAPASETT